MSRWIAFPVVLLWANTSLADGYLNCATTESDVQVHADTLLCEDFELPGVSGGNWYGEDCDTANSSGGIVERTKGWCGTIYANPITPAGASTCGGAGVGDVGCAGDHGTLDGSEGGRNMADHDFLDQVGVTELYVRYYQKWLSGYEFGAEKVLTFNESAGSGGIKWGNLHINCGTGSASSTGTLQWQPVGGGFSSCLDITQVTSGVWYAIQIHAVLSTTDSSNDGLLQIWVDDCGAAGTSCPSTPTLRLDQANMSWNRGDPAEQFGALWWENWANPGSVGTSYVDQIVVSKSGPIGFPGAPIPADGGPGGAGNGGSAGSTAGGSGGGGGSGNASAGGATNGGASATPSSSDDDGGCGCRVIRDRSDQGRGIFALVCAALLGVCVRRRRATSHAVALAIFAIATVGTARSARANEARCQELGASCVCAEPFDTSVFDPVGQSWFNPGDTPSQECSTEGLPGGALTRNSSDIFGSSDGTALAALPPGHQIQHFVALPDGHAGTFFAGHTLGDQFLKRAAARWYIYHSPDFAFAEEGDCKNSKLAQFNSGLLLDKSFGPVHAYNFLTWSCASQPCSVPVDCCMSGPGPDNVDKPDWRGNWFRVEVVFRNREGGDPGFDMKVYLQNVTTGEPELTVVDLEQAGSEWTPSSTLLPPERMDGLVSNNHRDGTCKGWLGLSHYMAAGWDTDEGQRIGPAVEIEGAASGGAGGGAGGVAVGGSAAGGGAGAGNTTGSGGSAAGGSGGQPADGDEASDNSGCGCKMAPENRAHWLTLIGVLLALGSRRRRPRLPAHSN